MSQWQDNVPRSRMLMEVEQLRIHSSMKRLPLSRTLRELVDYCNQNAQKDALLTPVRENPFREKKSCNIVWFDSLLIHGLLLLITIEIIEQYVYLLLVVACNWTWMLLKVYQSNARFRFVVDCIYFVASSLCTFLFCLRRLTLCDYLCVMLAQNFATCLSCT